MTHEQLFTTHQMMPRYILSIGSPSSQLCFARLFFILCHIVWNFPFAQFRSVVLVLFPSKSLPPCPPSLAGQYKKLRKWNGLGSVQHCTAATKTVVCYQHCFSPNSKCRVISATMKEKSSSFQLKPG